MSSRVPFAPRRLCAAVALGAAACPAALAQSSSQALNLPDTVVTATRMQTRADALVSDVRVIDRQAIEAAGAGSLSQLLARVGGVQSTATGGIGRTASVFLRGSENRHAILLVDGVRVGSGSAGIPTWDAIPLESIERVEVLQGPASALYGADAAGGVVQVFTRKGREGLHPSVALTAGSRGRASAAAALEGGQGALGWSLGLQRLRDRGISSTNPRVPFGNFNGDTDPFEQDAVNASARYAINADWRADATLAHSDGTAWFDDGPGRDARSAVRSLVATTGLRGRVAAGWHTELRVGHGKDTSNTIVASFPGAFQTTETQWSWLNELDTPAGTVLAGLERREQRVDSDTTRFSVNARRIDAVFVGINGQAGAHSWQANLRRDRNSQFGGKETGFVGYGLRLSPALRAHASWGTSFVAPSFNQLYFPSFGNPLLQPESGRNTDIGITWAQDGHEVKLVRFDNRIRGFMTNTTLPQNIPRVRIDGWSLAYAGKLGAGFTLRATLDALDPRNQVSGRQLPRRAKRQATLGADWQQGALSAGGSLLHVAGRFDDVANTLPLAAYTTLDLHGRWQFRPDMSVQLELRNATNRSFETAYGYNQPGRGAYLTLRWQPK